MVIIYYKNCVSDFNVFYGIILIIKYLHIFLYNTEDIFVNGIFSFLQSLYFFLHFK